MKSTKQKKDVLYKIGFSESEEKKILAARRNGKSIKAIAKEMHVSDKRISAFLRFEENKKSECVDVKKSLSRLTDEMSKFAERDARKFIASFTRTLLEEIEKVLKGNNNKTDNLLKNLDTTLTQFITAAMSVAMLTMWSMPKDVKQLWLNLASVDSSCNSEECCKEQKKCKK